MDHGYVHGPGEGDAYDWRGAHIVIKADVEQTLGHHPHSFTVLGESPARALVVVSPPQLDQQIRATGHRT